MQYRNTPHPSTGKTTSELMFNRVVRTRLPTMRKTTSTTAVQEAREKDIVERLKRNEVRDRRKTAQDGKARNKGAGLSKEDYHQTSIRP